MLTLFREDSFTLHERRSSSRICFFSLARARGDAVGPIVRHVERTVNYCGKIHVLQFGSAK